MLDINEISAIHLELSSYCNARCPGCPRNFYGLKYNAGYKENNLTLNNIKHIFKNKFLEQIKHIRINGNFGDFIMNPESLDIIKWILNENNNIDIKITTNGSAQRKQFWEELGKLKVKVIFAIDGFNESHEKYRQGSNFNTVINNAITFINSGGYAIAKFIRFDFNKHEESKLKEYVLNKGFSKFQSINNGRGYLPVFTEDGKKILDIDSANQTHLNFSTNSSLSELIDFKINQDLILEDLTQFKPIKEIRCSSLQNKEIYISSIGDVYPCCFLGFEPKTFSTSYHKISNEQFKSYINKNNAIVNDLVDCVEWFNKIEKTWNQKSYKTGQLIICQENCGVKE